jgi:hypothetical protein
MISHPCRWQSQHHNAQQQRRRKNEVETTHFAPHNLENGSRPSCKFERAKNNRGAATFHVHGEFKPLAKPFKTKQQAQKTRSKWGGSDQIVIRGSHSAAKANLSCRQFTAVNNRIAFDGWHRCFRILNHNFQPQRSHLNRSSGFALDAELPQRGHLIVQI